MGNLLPTRAQQPDKMDDAVARVYIALASAYTLLIVAGLYALYRNRSNPAIRMRNVPLTFAAVILLHLYLAAVFVIFPIKDRFPCSAEFWIMSIFFPTGVALFQALNLQLLVYALRQQYFLRNQTTCADFQARTVFDLRQPRHSWSHLDWLQRTYVGIGIGLAVQLMASTVIYFGSRRFHNSYGFFGVHVDSFHCRRGYEWIPTVFWQFFWTYFFGPYVLYKIRHIRDAHYWALQTRLAVLACLPGTPFWLAFLYSNSPVAQAVNNWFIPAMWYAPGLIMMESVSVFIPLWDVYRLKLSEYRQAHYSFVRVSSEYETKDARKSTMYTMTALDTAISKNLNPLLRWAAEVDFTGENIIFLRDVRNWKKRWLQRMGRDSPLTQAELRECYEEAGLIYFKCVNPETAQVPINVNSRLLDYLAHAFKDLRFCPGAAQAEPSPRNLITPWEDDKAEAEAGSPAKMPFARDKYGVRHTVDMLYPVPITEIQQKSQETICDQHSGTGLEVPASFSLDVFDQAFAAVRYLVFTNTWTRFVEAGETSSIADSETSTDSNWTYNSSRRLFESRFSC